MEEILQTYPPKPDTSNYRRCSRCRRKLVPAGRSYCNLCQAQYMRERRRAGKDPYADLDEVYLEEIEFQNPFDAQVEEL